MTQEAHTPEPWHVDAVGCHNDYRLRLCEPMRNGFPLATIAQFEFNWRDAGQYDRQISYREAEGNARRAAACVNALAGIPIEAIESGVVAELVQAARELIASRDANCFEREEYKTGGAYGDYWSPHSSMVGSEAVAGLRNALNKLEASK